MFTELEKLKDKLENSTDTAELTTLDFADWLAHPMTAALFDEIKAYLIGSMSNLAENTPHDEQARIMELLMRGEVNMCKWVLAWQPEHIRDLDNG